MVKNFFCYSFGCCKSLQSSVKLRNFMFCLHIQTPSICTKNLLNLQLTLFSESSRFIIGNGKLLTSPTLRQP